MSNGSTYFKYSVFLITVLVTAWLLNKLNCGGIGGTRVKNDTISVTKIVTIHKVDTVIKRVPEPYKVETPPDTIWNEVEVWKYDSIPTVLRKAYADYHSKKYYSDTFQLDYSGERQGYNVGHVIVKDTIYKNSIQGRSFESTVYLKEITNTITLREQPRIVGYFGFGVVGNISTPIAATEIDFGLKLKNDSYIGVKGMLLRNGEPMYGVQYMRPIRLRKR